jgi:Glycosyltransferase family 87
MPAPYGSFDLVQYWSAYRLFLEGTNPYDPAATLALQCGAQLHCEYPRITYTPPWLWFLMAPALRLDLAGASFVWLWMAVGFVGLSGLLLAWAYGVPPRRAWAPAAVLLMSAPMLVNLPLGQISALLLLAATLVVAGLVRQSPALLGIGVFLFTAKPHLFLPVTAVLGVWSLRSGHRRWIAWTAAVFVLAVGASELVQQGVVASWFGHLLFPHKEQGVKAAVDWWTASPASALALALTHRGYANARWPMAALPGGAALAGLLWLRRVPTPDWARAAPVLLWVSVAAAPFVWFCDFLVAGIAPAAAVARAQVAGMDRLAFRLLSATLAYHMACLIRPLSNGGFADIDYWWFPLGLILVWAYGDRALQRR